MKKLSIASPDQSRDSPAASFFVSDQRVTTRWRFARMPDPADRPHRFDRVRLPAFDTECQPLTVNDFGDPSSATAAHPAGSAAAAWSSAVERVETAAALRELSAIVEDEYQLL